VVSDESIGVMLDTFLNWFSISIPLIFALVANLLALKLPDGRHYHKFLAASIMVAVLFSGVIWWQQIRAARQAGIDREKSINDTATKVAQSVRDEDAPRFAEQSKQIANLKSQLESQGKNVSRIGNSPFISGKKPVPVEVTNPASPAPARYGVLTISQSDQVSTRADAPFEIGVTIQTTVAFPSLNLTFGCDQNLVAVRSSFSYAASMTRQGILTERPTAYLFSYGSANPEFDPAHPLVFNVWSKEPIKCSQVQTF
jgi:hypothetical protein